MELWGTQGVNFFFIKHGHKAYQIDREDEQNRMQVKFSSLDQTDDLWVRSKGQISLNFVYICQILRFRKQTLRAFLQIKDRKHIEQNLHSVAGVMPQGWDLGCWVGQKLKRGDLRWLPIHCTFYFKL